VTGSATLGRIVIDGKGKDQQVVRFDGIDATPMVDAPGGDGSLDAVGSFQKPEVAFNLDAMQAKTKAFDSEHGPGTGAVTPGLSYSGPGDHWAVEGYGVHRNAFFNARNFFDYDGKSPIRRTRFGVKAGGYLNKTTQVFSAYEAVRGRTEQTIYEAVPVDARRGSSGPLSALMTGYLPPGTVLIDGSLDANFLLAKRRGRSSVEADSFNIRADSRHENGQSSVDRWVFRFTRQTATNILPDGVTGRIQRQSIEFNNLLAGWTRTVGFAFHEFRFGLNQTAPHVESQNVMPVPPALFQSLISTNGTVPVAGLPDGRTRVFIASLGNLLKGGSRGFDLNPRALSASYNLTYGTISKVQVKAGVEARWIHLAYDRLGGLTYAFPNLDAVRTGTGSEVTFLSDLSAPSPFTIGLGKRHANQAYLLSFIQFSSQVKPRLKLTSGFRYDQFGAVSERDNRAVVVDPATGMTLPVGTAFYTAGKSNFQPRFALEYKVDKAGKVIFTAGAGVYSDVPRIGDLLLPIDSDRFNIGMKQGAYPTNPADLMNAYLQNTETRQFQPLAFARNFRTPERAYKWQAQLVPIIKTLKLTFLYTGNLGRNLPLAGIANQITRVETNPDPTQLPEVWRQFDTKAGDKHLQPLAEFYYRTSEGRSSYNALSIKAERNGADGDAFEALSAGYTLSRNFGNVSGTVTSNPLSFDSDLGYNGSDARHSLSAQLAYNLFTALKKKQHNVNFFKRWRISSSVKASSGLPLVVRLDRPDVVYVDAVGNIFSSPAVGRKAIINLPGGAAANTRVPNFLSGVKPYLNNDRSLLNPEAFAIPAPGKIGDLKRGQLRSRPTFQVDLAFTHFLYRSKAESPKISSVDFRVEVFNIFNHTNFGAQPVMMLPNALGTAAKQIQPNVPFTRDAAGSSFGLLTAAGQPREFQFTLIVRFHNGFTK
jgi:hypothetical protein